MDTGKLKIRGGQMKQKVPKFKRQAIMGLEPIVEDGVIEIPDNSKLLQLGRQNHPRVIAFLTKYNSQTNTDYAKMQRGEYA